MLRPRSTTDKIGENFISLLSGRRAGAIIPGHCFACVEIQMVEIDSYRIVSEPYYRQTGEEVHLFEAAYRDRLPVMLKGPTGCGKTRSSNIWPGGSGGRS